MTESRPCLSHPPERLTELLEWSCRIVIANETGAEKAVTSGRGLCFQHEDGSTQSLFYYGLNIGPAQTCVFDNDRPARSLVVLIETVCSSWRIGNRGIIEAYVMASENASQSVASGHRRHSVAITVV
jgi:hypothetical protein